MNGKIFLDTKGTEMMNELNELIDIAKRKALLDQHSSWCAGASTYLQEIKNEVDEVIEEMPNQRLCFLEDELADVLWDYVNSLVALEKECSVSINSVLRRACKKYEERVSAIESGVDWASVKQTQKLRLTSEYQESVQNNLDTANLNSGHIE